MISCLTQGLAMVREQSFDPKYNRSNEVTGPSYQWAKELYEAWTHDFDWLSVQKEINEFPQFITSIENINIHLLHAPAKSPNAIPLLMVHGWPGSFWEFSQTWDPLSNPSDKHARILLVRLASTFRLDSPGYRQNI